MAVMLDEKITRARRKNFAGEIEKIPSDIVEHMQSKIQGDQSPEFYEGLLAGLVYATTLWQGKMGGYIGAATAVVSDHCERNEFL